MILQNYLVFLRTKELMPSKIIKEKNNLKYKLYLLLFKFKIVHKIHFA
jgi:hypothetical protein